MLERLHFGVWRSLVACFVRDEEAAGSNPVTPTNVMSQDIGDGWTYFRRFGGRLFGSWGW
jgi:hypothetical protein